MKEKQHFSLSSPDKPELELPVLNSSAGPRAIDISGVYSKLDCFTYDPGFVSTASCESAITYIDGEKGLLRYRGYPIEQLAESATYPEVAYLLLNGELPTVAQLEQFNRSLNEHAPFADERIPNLLKVFPRNAHPMSMVMAALCALAAQYYDETEISNAEYRMRSAHRLIAQIATIVAAVFQHQRGYAAVPADAQYGYTENWLRMIGREDGDLLLDDAGKRRQFARVMDIILILHADHEQNASTSTVRMAGSTETNPYAAVASGVAALWGPAHGGANEAVIHMLKQMVSSDKPVSFYINRAKDANDSFRLMGFGHRVYKNYDPRATIIRKSCHELLSVLGEENGNRPLLDTAIELERVALEDEYFVERRLYPNVDFYSGIIFKALGIPDSMFTTIFALARMSGWVSHWKEMHEHPPLRISRPRQLYSGSGARDYVPIDAR